MTNNDLWQEGVIPVENCDEQSDRTLFIQRLEQQNEVLRRKNIDLLLEIEMLKDMLRHREQ